MPPESRRPSSVASTSAAAPATESAKGPDLALEWEIFWTENWKRGLAAILIALVGVIVFAVWQYIGHSASRAANNQLSAAKTIDDLKKVLTDHPNADAAADAGLLLAQKQAEAKDFEGAAKSSQTVADRFPSHPMFGAALLAVGANLEAAGKADQADAAYKTVVEKAPKDFAAPLALAARANLAKMRKKPEEARKLWDELLAKYKTSASARLAEQEKKLIRGGEASADVFQMPPPTPLPTPAPEPAAPGAAVPGANSVLLPTAPAADVNPAPTPAAAPEATPAPAAAAPSAAPAATAAPSPAAPKATPKPKK